MVAATSSPPATPGRRDGGRVAPSTGTRRRHSPAPRPGRSDPRRAGRRGGGRSPKMLPALVEEADWSDAGIRAEAVAGGGRPNPQSRPAQPGRAARAARATRRRRSRHASRPAGSARAALRRRCRNRRRAASRRPAPSRRHASRGGSCPARRRAMGRRASPGVGPGLQGEFRQLGHGARPSRRGDQAVAANRVAPPDTTQASPGPSLRRAARSANERTSVRSSSS